MILQEVSKFPSCTNITSLAPALAGFKSTSAIPEIGLIPGNEGGSFAFGCPEVMLPCMASLSLVCVSISSAASFLARGGKMEDAFTAKGLFLCVDCGGCVLDAGEELQSELSRPVKIPKF